MFELDYQLATHKVVLRGNTGVAMASALNYYLKYFCFASVTWGVNGTGDQLALPSPLPVVPSKMRTVFPNKYRYYMNACTVRYGGESLLLCIFVFVIKADKSCFGDDDSKLLKRMVGFHQMAA